MRKVKEDRPANVVQVRLQVLRSCPLPPPFHHPLADRLRGCSVRGGALSWSDTRPDGPVVGSSTMSESAEGNTIIMSVNRLDWEGTWGVGGKQKTENRLTRRRDSNDIGESAETPTTQRHAETTSAAAKLAHHQRPVAASFSRPNQPRQPSPPPTFENEVGNVGQGAKRKKGKTQ